MRRPIVLLLEDEPIVALHVAAELNERGCQVLINPNLATVIDMCRAQAADIALLNFFQTPKADGMGLARELLHWHPSLRVMFITGARRSDLLASPDFEARFFVLYKPFSRRQLRQVLRDCLA